MPAPDLRQLVAPSHTAVLTMEVQEGVVGPRAPLRELADVAGRGMIDNLAALCRAARAVGVPVVHCTAEGRADGLGANRNARLLIGMRKMGGGAATGGRGSMVDARVGVDERDLVLPRLHGVSPMTGTQVDNPLRNMGVTTIVGTGVSVNVGVMGMSFEAVNLGYQLVLPRDATAGVGDDYVDAVYRNTLSLIATVTTTAEVIAAWEATPA